MAQGQQTFIGIINKFNANKFLEINNYMQKTS